MRPFTALWKRCLRPRYQHAGWSNHRPSWFTARRLEISHHAFHVGESVPFPNKPSCRQESVTWRNVTPAFWHRSAIHAARRLSRGTDMSKSRSDAALDAIKQLRLSHGFTNQDSLGRVRRCMWPLATESPPDRRPSHHSLEARLWSVSGWPTIRE
jgi:hypothetical protein